MMGHGVSLLLISAAAGYWVLTLSASQRGRVRTLGQWLGLAIVIVSIAGAACKVYCLSTGQTARGWMGKACPLGARAGLPAAQP